MATELERIASFKNVCSQTTFMSCLAGDGFYFRKDNKLECVACGFTGDNTEIDTLMARHRVQSPHCSFIKCKQLPSDSHQNIPKIPSELLNYRSNQSSQQKSRSNLQVDGLSRQEVLRRDFNLETDSDGHDHQNRLIPQASTTQNGTAASARTAPTRNQGRQSDQLDMRIIKARLDTPIVQKLVEIGYSRELIRDALYQRFLDTGDDFPDAKSLLRAVLDLQSGQDTVPLLTPRLSSNTRDVAPDLGHDVIDSGSSKVTVDGHVTESTPARNSSDYNLTVDSALLLTTKQNMKSNSAQSGSARNTKADRKENEELNRLQEEHSRLIGLRTCKVCLDAVIDSVFLPCGHLTSCTSCASQLKTCPICRTTIKGTCHANLV